MQMADNGELVISTNRQPLQSLTEPGVLETAVMPVPLEGSMDLFCCGCRLMPAYDAPSA